MIGIYRPPSMCPHIFQDEFYKYLSSVKSDLHIIISDIHIDILNENSEVSQIYKYILSKFRYTSTENKIIRIKHNSGLYIDYNFIRNGIYCKSPSAIVQTSITDRYGTVLKIDFPGHETCPKVRWKQTFDSNKFVNFIKDEIWADVYRAINANTSAKLFMNKLKLFSDACTKILKIKHRIIKRKEWITESLVRSVIKKKNTIYTMEWNCHYSYEKKN